LGFIFPTPHFSPVPALSSVYLFLITPAFLSVLLIIGAVFLTACIMAVIIFISKSKKLREKTASNRAEREEKRAMKKRMK